jgi:hypothetical protein
VDRDRAIKKALFWMKQEDIINPNMQDRAEEYLREVYGAGCCSEIRNLLAHHKKKVEKVSKKGDVVVSYPSVREAARQEKVGDTGIYSAIERGSLTKQGYYWRYADTL